MVMRNLPPFHEQRKIEKLLLKLAKLKPMSAKLAPIMTGSSLIKVASEREKAR
jgi:hypothetical protein